MKNVFKSQYLEINIDETNNIIILIWDGFIKSDEYRFSLNHALDIAKQYNISKWLTDARKVKVISLCDQEWVISDWVPRAVTLGYKYQAIVVPEDIYGKISADSLISGVGYKRITGKNFYDFDSAKQWILELTD